MTKEDLVEHHNAWIRAAEQFARDANAQPNAAGKKAKRLARHAELCHGVAMGYWREASAPTTKASNGRVAEQLENPLARR